MLKFVRRLFRSESGNVLMIGAATLPMVMGAAGLAVDTVQLALWKRQLQRAADSAALAGAHAMVQGASTNQAIANDLDEHIDYDLDKNETAGTPVAEVDPGSYAAGIISDESCSTRGAANCWDRAVRVTLSFDRRLPFFSMFTKTLNRVEADSVAAVDGGGDFCMIALHNGNTPGIIVGGNPKLNMKCGIATNSRAGANAINIYGNAKVIASPLASVGGIKPGKNIYQAQVMQPFSSPVADPYAYLPDPVAPSSCNSGTLDVQPNTALAITQSTNCFANWSIKGNVTLAPGTYYVNGGKFDLGAQASVTGTNVTIVMLGDDSGFEQNGGANLKITAPTDGPYSGVAIYRHRQAANKTPTKINGGAGLEITGVVYMPSTDIWVGGNADFATKCLQVIGRILSFKGGGSVENDCDGTTVQSARQPIVRLVE